MLKNTYLLVLLLAMFVAQAQEKKRTPANSAKPESSKIENKPALAAPQKITTVEGITEYRLQNGLRVLL